MRSLIQAMDNSGQVPHEDMHKVVDESQRVAYSGNTPVGFVFSNLPNLVFKHPTLGLCHIEYDGNHEDLIKWKDKFESELQYGTDIIHPKLSSPEAHELSFLEHQKRSMKVVFNPLLNEYQKMVSLARTDAHRKFKWGGLFLLSAQLGFVARLTWFEYSWDIMEPITWMLTYAMMVGTFAYYIVTSQEYLVPSVERRLTISKFWKLAQKQNFDVNKFRKLREQIKQLDEKILRLKSLG
ncbi:calcium uniporter regulatory subunit MCUb, mitochondrial-like [Oppia nitens]|uniref:calcium uniporter regulatory subunit MCUb, mitochondrial-like n=1 Tax=Oppia nitens TaxID=1686743 RepID=UPI0023DC49C0|nr:calcium uniporter regulatory subunit MCUb, mitochondrial-like [Oppia nitens]